MGKYDDLTADLPPTVNASGQMNTSAGDGRFDDLLSDLPPVSQSGGKPPLGFVASQIENLAPWNKANVAYKKGVGNFAEFAGKHTNLDPTQIGAALIPVAMAPEILGVTSGWNGIQESENPVIKGLVNTPKQLSPEYDELLQNPKLEISGKTPELGGAKATFPNPYTQTLSTKPPTAIQTDTAYPTNLRGAEPLPSTVPLKYPGQADNPRAFINYANARIQGFGDQLSPQEVTDYGKIISQYYKDGVFPKGSPLAADGAKLSSQVDSLQNSMIPGKQNLDTAYGIAKTQQAIRNFILKAPLYLGEGATGLYGLKKAYQWLTTPTGQ